MSDRFNCSTQDSGRAGACDGAIAIRRAHSTPDPDAVPPSPVPDDVPSPTNAPVEEPTLPEPPIKAVSIRA